MLLNEAMSTLKKLGYKMVKEEDVIKESFRTFKKSNMMSECGDSEYYEDNAEAVGIAYADDEEFGECPVCVICGKECCDGEGEYSEDGDFVCADCVQNTEQEMAELDPNSFWDDKIPSKTELRARRMVNMEESLHDTKYGRILDEELEGLDDDDYIDPELPIEDGLEDSVYIDPEENLDDDPIEDYNGEEGLSDEDYIDPEENLYAEDEESLGESCSCGKKGCKCEEKKSKKKGKSNKGWVPFWMYKKNKKDED